jgi:hypothetical protein
MMLYVGIQVEEGKMLKPLILYVESESVWNEEEENDEGRKLNPSKPPTTEHAGETSNSQKLG